jgi:glycyl-tRNA synthetase beta chain
LTISLQSTLAENDRRDIKSALEAAIGMLRSRDWHGLAGEIARTGEEDPLALVDDLDLQAVIAAKMELRRSHEALMFRDLELPENDFGKALLEFEAAPPSRSADEGTAFFGSVAAKVQVIIDNLAQRRGSRDQEIARLFLLSKFHDLAEPLVEETP